MGAQAAERLQADEVVGVDQIVDGGEAPLFDGQLGDALTCGQELARLDADRIYLAELQSRAEAAIAAGQRAAEAISSCADMRYANRDQNEGAHRLNVETAFLELGGKPEPGHDGWNRFQ